MMRWFIIALAFLASILNYLDRSALAYAIEPIQKTFHLNNMNFGLIAAAFGVGYLLMSVLGGILVDQYGARKIWTIFSILWSIACALIGTASGLGTLILYRTLLGLAEAPCFPALSRVVADWLPLKERARALAVVLAAVPFASVIGAPLITHLMDGVGWRFMFVILGSAGLFWALLWYLVFRDQPQQETTPAEKHLSKNPTTWRYLLFHPALVINNYAFFVFGYLLFFAINWLPGYMEQTYHMPIKTVGWFLMMPWLTATIFILLGGFISDWLMHRTQSIRVARSHLIWTCQVLSALCFLPILLTDSFVVAAAAISLGMGFGLMPNAAFYALNADLAHDKAATSLGLMNCASASAGILAPLLTGWLTELTGNFFAPILLLILFTTSSAIAIVLFQHPDKIAQLKTKTMRYAGETSH